MAVQLEEQLSVWHAPQSGACVSAGRRQSITSLVEYNAQHRTQMAERGQLLSAGRIPQAGGAVRSCCRDVVRTRTEHGLRDFATVVQRCAAQEVEVPEARSPILGPSHQAVPIAAEREGGD